MASLNEAWIQDVAESIKLPALKPSVCKQLVPVVELQVRKVLEQAQKFQKRAKSSKLTVDDFNLALSMNKIETVYGLSFSEGELSSKAASNSNVKQDYHARLDLTSIARNALPAVPLKPQMNLHWLAVNGQQPLIPENPSTVVENEEQPITLPKELQHLYARITGIILSAETSDAVNAVLKVFETDSGLQALMPYFSRFFYQQVKMNMKKLPILVAIIKSIRALLHNVSLRVNDYVQQLLPVIFTCAIGARLCVFDHEDHWTLRELSANVIAIIYHKFSGTYADLEQRLFKTYLDALQPDKSLSTVYGGLVGLASLGITATKNLLLPQLAVLQTRLMPEKSVYNADKVIDVPLLQSKKLLTSTIVELDAELFSAVNAENSEVMVATASTSGSAHAQETNGVNTKKRKLSNMEDSTTVTLPNPVNKDRKPNKLARLATITMTKEAAKCQQILLKVLGNYVKSSLKVQFGEFTSVNFTDGNRTFALCDLEERLVPYFTASSKQDCHCRLVL